MGICPEKPEAFLDFLGQADVWRVRGVDYQGGVLGRLDKFYCQKDTRRNSFLIIL